MALRLASTSSPISRPPPLPPIRVPSSSLIPNFNRTIFSHFICLSPDSSSGVGHYRLKVFHKVLDKCVLVLHLVHIPDDELLKVSRHFLLAGAFAGEGFQFADFNKYLIEGAT